MANSNLQTLKLAFLPLFLILHLHHTVTPTRALNLGVQADTGVTVGKECSRTCESSFCDVAPFLRYGKYCGLLYGGCPGEKPCDGLDACCMIHDACILSKNNDYLSQECNQNLVNCIGNFKKSRGKSFKGNTCKAEDVIQVITVAMDAALLAGRVLHRP